MRATTSIGCGMRSPRFTRQIGHSMTPHRRIQLGIMVTLLLGLAFLQRPDGQLHIFLLEGSGDAMLIQTPTGAHILIDGGSDPAALTSQIGAHMPFWKRHLDAVILTLADRKYIPGQVAALKRYQATLAVVASTGGRGALANEWRQQLQASQTSIKVVSSGKIFRLNGLAFQVLAVGDQEEDGLVLRLDYGSTSVVFAHTIGDADERLLGDSGLRPATMLAYPWGRDPNNPFVVSIAPASIVFTDGQVVEPSAQLTMTQRTVAGASYHERLHGLIEWVSDGRRASTRVSRNYCAASDDWTSALFPSTQSISASCNNRERS